MNKGFTLLEMMIAVSIMAVIIMGGTMIFYKTLSSSGANQAEINVSTASNQVLKTLENSIRFKKISSVGANIRADCELAGSVGVNGDSLSVYDDFGSTIYRLNNQQIASDSAIVPTPIINTPNILITSLVFNWFCTPGANDKIRMTIKTNSNPSAGNSDKSFSIDVNMYNSN